MAALARDEVDVDIAALSRREEIGEMARGVAVFRDNVRVRQALGGSVSRGEAERGPPGAGR